MRFSRSQQFSEGLYLKKEKKKRKRYLVPVLEAECSIYHFLRRINNFYNASSYILSMFLNLVVVLIDVIFIL